MRKAAQLATGAQADDCPQGDDHRKDGQGDGEVLDA